VSGGRFTTLISNGELNMERHPYHGGEIQSNQPEEQEEPPACEVRQPNSDHRLIYDGITEALREERSIDHATARVIATQLHVGQDTPLYALAASGAVVEGLAAELDGLRAEDIRLFTADGKA
jgi:hypothetical protein